MKATVGYRPPNHIGVVNASARVTDEEVAYWVEGIRVQLAEVARDWGWGAAAPGVFLYTRASTIARAEGAMLVILDSLSDPTAAGWHNPLGGMVGIAESGAHPERTLSHEAVEMWGNFYMDRWVPGPEGLDYAIELADAVEWDTYPQEVSLLGSTRTVHLSNYLLPSWFQAGAPGPYDRLGLLHQPFEMRPGAYQIAKNASGAVVPLRFGATGLPSPGLRVTSRRARIMLRLFGESAPGTPGPTPPPKEKP